MPDDVRARINHYRATHGGRRPVNANQAARDREFLLRLVDRLEAEIARLTTCWHCSDVLDAPALNCGNCPGEGDCDDDECPHPGCADDVAAFRGEASRGS
ncbi:hypothetical protein [Caudoviricetes sp.]|nr:hypothetical protein [Caudoviricetes sp.]